MKIRSGSSGSSSSGIATNRCANDGWKFYHWNMMTTTAIVAIVAMPMKMITAMTRISSYGR